MLTSTNRAEGTVTVKVSDGMVAMGIHKASSADGAFSATLTGPNMIHTLGDIELEAP